MQNMFAMFNAINQQGKYVKGVKQERINVVQATQTNVEESSRKIKTTSSHVNSDRKLKVRTDRYCFFWGGGGGGGCSPTTGSSLSQGHHPPNSSAQTHFNDVKMRCQDGPRGENWQRIRKIRGNFSIAVTWCTCDGMFYLFISCKTVSSTWTHTL